jgi:CubicO group peptidase (beta-lactamase class C family)
MLRIMRKISGALLVLVVSLIVVPDSVSATTTAARTCKQILAKFPNGIARNRASSRAAESLGYAKPAIQAKLYRSVRRLDRLKNGTACVVEANKRTPLPGLSAPTVTSATEPQVLGHPAVSEAQANAVGSAGGMCMVAMRDGKILGEWYFGGSTPTTRYLPASSSKPAAAAVVGAAIQLGRLKLDQSAADFIPQWRGTSKAGITVRHLLTHTSGLKASALESALAFYTSAGTSSSLALNLPLTSAPGTTFDYDSSTVALQVLVKVVEGATGESFRSFAEKYVFRPAGMANTGYKGDDPATNGEQGDPALGIALNTTCRDLARLGQLFHQKGRWENQQLFSSQFASDATSVQIPNAILPNIGAATYGFLHSFNYNTIGHLGGCGHVLATMPSGVTVAMMSNTPYHPTLAAAQAQQRSATCALARVAAVTQAALTVARLGF